jgi:hypothetical protein
MSIEREERHLPVMIAICFIGNFVLGAIGQSFPNDSFGQVFAWQWGSLFFMAGTSLYAAKLHTDGWHISSAGFILLSIGQGIIYTMQNAGHNEEAMGVFALGVMVFFPGMLFLSYYSGFPVWLRLLGLLAVLPFMVVMAKIDMKTFEEHKDMGWNIAGFVMLQSTSVLWSYFVLRPYKNTKVQH